MDKRKTIVWDVDDVLNDLMGSWFLVWCQGHPGCTVGYKDLKKNPPHELLGITMESYLQSLDAFRLSASYQGMSPTKAVKDWFLQNGDKFRHIALTAVPLRAASFTAQWVFKNFGAWIRTFHFVPSKRKDEMIPQYEDDKAEALRCLGAVDLFIDDNAEHVGAARKAGIQTLFFPRPWNPGGMSVNEILTRLQAVNS
jgi:phosphoglycolate phosphatase-like HAD superfamily hydrolase